MTRDSVLGLTLSRTRQSRLRRLQQLGAAALKKLSRVTVGPSDAGGSSLHAATTAAVVTIAIMTLFIRLTSIRGPVRRYPCPGYEPGGHSLGGGLPLFKATHQSREELTERSAGTLLRDISRLL